MNYKRSRYFTTSDKRKIKYLFDKKKSRITVVFFHGFMSDMIGAKPTAIQKFCKKLKLNFLKFEYSGHGRSSGKFVKGNISQWTKDAKQLIRSKVKKNNLLIFIGSSMGSWIALNLLSTFKKKIKGFIGIASAPEFLEHLMWKKFSKKIKKHIFEKKIYHLEHGGFTYPLTKQLILDGRKSKIFNKKIDIPMFASLLHGTKDKVVPLSFSRKTLKIFKNAEKKLIKVKKGDHSLSRDTDLRKIFMELKYFSSMLNKN